MQNFDVKEVGAAIAFIDASWGLQVPIIVFGYHCVGRSKSIRSDKRVITHLIVALQSGKSAPGTFELSYAVTLGLCKMTVNERVIWVCVTLQI